MLDDADLIFLTVPDDAIADVAAGMLLYSGQALVHTQRRTARVRARAGDGGGHERWAASIRSSRSPTSTGRSADLAGATIALEGDESLLPLLAELAESIGAQPVASARRRQGRLPRGGSDGRGRLDRPADAIAQVAAARRPRRADGRGRLRAAVAPGAGQRRARGHRRGAYRALSCAATWARVRAHLAVLGRSSRRVPWPLYVAVARRELAIARRRA